MYKGLLTFLALFLFACISSAAAVETGWETYFNAEYKFSIQHPDDLEVTQSEYGPYFKVGEQITIGVSEMNPLECRGDCPVIEKQETVTLAGREATRAEGYIGSVGGFIPQQYASYILKHENQYYEFMIHAASSGEALDAEDLSTIRPLKAEDLELFEKIMSTLAFIN